MSKLEEAGAGSGVLHLGTIADEATLICEMLLKLTLTAPPPSSSMAIRYPARPGYGSSVRSPRWLRPPGGYGSKLDEFAKKDANGPTGTYCVRFNWKDGKSHPIRVVTLRQYLIFDYVKVFPFKGVHGIIGVKPLSHQGKYMRNKESLILVEEARREARLKDFKEQRAWRWSILGLKSRSRVLIEYMVDLEWLDFSTVYIMGTDERLSWRQLCNHVKVTPTWEHVLNEVRCVVIVPS
ncbi:hypothetical protein ACFX13_030430 [Malus domestica]